VGALDFLTRWFGRRPSPPPAAPAVARSSKRTQPVVRPLEPLQYDEIAAFDPALRQQMTGAERTLAHQLTPLVRARCLRMISELPPFPVMTSRILTAMEDPDSADLNELTRLVSQDTAIAAAILRISNSAAYMRDHPIESIRDAILRIGMAEAGRVVGALATRQVFCPDDAGVDLGWDRQWQNSLISAFGAAWLAFTLRNREADRAFVGGLLHDIGKLPVLRALAAMMVEKDLRERPSDAVLGFAMEELHTEIGGLVAEQWQLPDFVKEVVVGHHTAAEAEPVGQVTHIVSVVTHLEEMRSNPLHRGDLAFSMRHSASALGLDDRTLRKTLAELRTLAVKVDELASASRPSQSRGGAGRVARTA
jgi:HD-like signal output (HDOD) protein